MTIDDLFEGVDMLDDAEQVMLLTACRNGEAEAAGKILIKAHELMLIALASDPEAPDGLPAFCKKQAD